jgi:prepilin-type N-terminal cleavage/methylation domain-containing protein
MCHLRVIQSATHRSHVVGQGFTVMELLVVVLIVAVLAAILSPALFKAQRHAKSSVLAGADAALAKLTWQELAYRAPRRMEIGASALVEVALGGNQSFDQLSQLLQSSGNATGQRVQVADRMEAHLTGSGFEITPATPEIQLVSTRQPTLWQWQVKASDLGTHTLYLSLNAILKVNGKDATKSIRTFQREIVVDVTSTAGSWAFVERYWIYIVAVLSVIGALIAYIWKKYFP